MKDEKEKINYDEINEPNLDSIMAVFSALISVISGIIAFFLASKLVEEMFIFRIILDVFGVAIILYGISGVIKSGSVLAFKAKLKSGTEDEDKYIKANKIGNKVSTVGEVIKNILVIVLTIAIFGGLIVGILFESTEEKHYELLIFIIPIFGIAIYSIIRNIKRKR